MGNAVARVCADTDDDATDATDVSVYDDRAPRPTSTSTLYNVPSGSGTVSQQLLVPGDPLLALSHFDLVRAIGHGSFGRVMLVRRYTNSTQYALKYIHKEQCVKQNAVRNVINERKILEKLEHPLVCNLQAAFQDDDHMYLVLDWMGGGDLAMHLDRQSTFREEVVRFHIAEIALAVDYLHRKKIVHRDVKPANVLLDENGHCHLTDFNVAGRIHSDRQMQTIAGTYNYIAPEVFRKAGYDERCDWWSLGVTMFECLYGKCPFRGKSRQDIKDAVLKHKITYPKKFKPTLSADCQSALMSFLEPDARQRLGGIRSAHPWRAHPWFGCLDLSSVEKRQATAPFLPEKGAAENNEAYEIEALLMNGEIGKPLKQKKPAGNKGASTNKADGSKGTSDATGSNVTEQHTLTAKEEKRRKQEQEEGSPWKLMRDEFKDFDRSQMPNMISPIGSGYASPAVAPHSSTTAAATTGSNVPTSGLASLNGMLAAVTSETEDDVQNEPTEPEDDNDVEGNITPSGLLGQPEGASYRRDSDDVDGLGVAISGDENSRPGLIRVQTTGPAFARGGGGGGDVSSVTTPGAQSGNKSTNGAPPKTADSDDPEFREDPLVNAALRSRSHAVQGTSPTAANGMPRANSVRERVEQAAAKAAASAKAAQEERVRAVLAGLSKARRPTLATSNIAVVPAGTDEERDGTETPEKTSGAAISVSQNDEDDGVGRIW